MPRDETLWEYLEARLAAIERQAARESRDTVSLKGYFDRRLEDMDRATELSRESIDARLVAMNEFRDALKDQTKQYITRPEHDALCSLVAELRESRAELRGMASQKSVTAAFIFSIFSAALGALGVALAVLK